MFLIHNYFIKISGFFDAHCLHCVLSVFVCGYFVISSFIILLRIWPKTNSLENVAPHSTMPSGIVVYCTMQLKNWSYCSGYGRWLVYSEASYRH